jgi:hypothetical protein
LTASSSSCGSLGGLGIGAQKLDGMSAVPPTPGILLHRGK